MNQSSRTFIGRSRLYRWLRYSSLYGWYAQVFRRPFARAVAADRSFYRALFAQFGVRVVYDVGANVGDKAEVFHRLADRVVCIEADPETAATLDYRFRGRSKMIVAATAVGDRVGMAELRRKRHSGFNTLSEKWACALDAQALPTNEVVAVPLTTLDHLVNTHGQPDYIKIDVEGYELPVISGLSTAVRILSFECNLPTFRVETNLVLDRLLALEPRTRFNARLGDSQTWMLPASIDADGLRRFLDGLPATTCDVYALGPQTL